MIVKTKGILLHHIRYTDNSIIAHFYTRNYGKVPMVVRGVTGKKGTNRNIYFQPLYLFNIEFYKRETRELQTLKELSLAFTPSEIPVNIYKSTIALFLSEVLYSVIREEEVNHQLFDFIESSVKALDNLRDGAENFHLWFLINFAAFAGIGPTPTENPQSYFDLESGMFTETMPLHSNFLDPVLSGIFNFFLISDLDNISEAHLSANERITLLEHLVNYYSLHLAGLRKIRSLQVLNDVFRR